MRILLVTQSYYPHVEHGGPPIKVRSIARRLVLRGHHVSVITANYGNPRATTNRRLDGVDVTYLSYVARYRTLTVNPGIVNYCRKQLACFDLVHIFGLYDVLGTVTGSFARRARVPYVLEPMGMFRPIVRSIWKKRIYYQLAGASLVKGAARLIATSDQERNELLEGNVAASQIVVRRNGLDFEPYTSLPEKGLFRRRWSIPDGAPLVLFLGRVARKKSIELLIEAVASLDIPSLRLIVAGPEDDRQYQRELELLVSHRQMSRQVLFVGPLYDADKLSAYVDADVFVLPSQNENFGNTVAEAIAAGTPVIVTACCGIASLVRDAGLVIPHDTDALVSALRSVLTDAALRDSLRSHCATIARELSWDEPMALQQTVYCEVVAGSLTSRSPVVAG